MALSLGYTLVEVNVSVGGTDTFTSTRVYPRDDLSSPALESTENTCSSPESDDSLGGTMNSCKAVVPVVDTLSSARLAFIEHISSSTELDKAVVSAADTSSAPRLVSSVHVNTLSSPGELEGVSVDNVIPAGCWVAPLKMMLVNDGELVEGGVLANTVDWHREFVKLVEFSFIKECESRDEEDLSSPI